MAGGWDDLRGVAKGLMGVAGDEGAPLSGPDVEGCSHMSVIPGGAYTGDTLGIRRVRDDWHEHLEWRSVA